MSKRDQIQPLQLVILLFKRLPFPVAIVVIAAGALLFIILTRTPHPRDIGGTGSGDVSEPQDGYLFCFWNVENLFDDQNEKRTPTDEHYDNPYANDKDFRDTKLRNLSKVLLAMNEGKGPDILAVAEIESDRAAELLQDRLNADLPEGAAPYKNRLFVEQKQGRHIAPAILTRLPVKGNRTQQLGQRSHRILKAQIDVNGQELTVIASHWKSRVQKSGAKVSDVEGRAKYADVIYGEYKAMHMTNPDTDLLICGDFNDDPDDDSVVKHLRATGSRSGLASGADPLLFNLAAGKDRADFGTLWYGGWNVFDQIVVSPGLLDDKGWTCIPETFKPLREKMANDKGHPWRFSDSRAGKHTKDNAERGYSDHFPVAVRLKVRD